MSSNNEKGGVLMKGKVLKLDLEKINYLIKENFEDDYKSFATFIEIDPSTVKRVISGKANGSTKFFSGLMGYCNQNDLDFDYYLASDNAEEDLST